MTASDTAEDGQRTSPPVRVPASRVRRCRVRWAGLAPAPARSHRSSCMPTLAAHGGSRGSWPAHIPIAPLRLRPRDASHRRRPGMLVHQAHRSSRRVADGTATPCAPTSCAAPGPPRAFPAPLRLRLPAGLPVAIQAARSGDRAFRTCGRTACAAV